MIQTVLHAVMNENVTIHLNSALYDTNPQWHSMIQDSKGTDTWDGPNSETFGFSSSLKRCYPALGTVDGVNFSRCICVTAKTFVLA